jgi:hypothetical protein
MKRADLAASVRKQLVGANGTANDLIDEFRRFVLAVDFLFLAVAEFCRNKAGAAYDNPKRVSYVGVRLAVVGYLVGTD